MKSFRGQARGPGEYIVDEVGFTHPSEPRCHPSGFARASRRPPFSQSGGEIDKIVSRVVSVGFRSHHRRPQLTRRRFRRRADSQSKWDRAAKDAAVSKGTPFGIQRHWNAVQSDHFQRGLPPLPPHAHSVEFGTEQARGIAGARRHGCLPRQSNRIEHELDQGGLGDLTEHPHTTVAERAAQDVHLEVRRSSIAQSTRGGCCVQQPPEQPVPMSRAQRIGSELRHLDGRRAGRGSKPARLRQRGPIPLARPRFPWLGDDLAAPGRPRRQYAVISEQGIARGGATIADSREADRARAVVAHHSASVARVRDRRHRPRRRWRAG